MSSQESSSASVSSPLDLRSPDVYSRLSAGDSESSVENSADTTGAEGGSQRDRNEVALFALLRSDPPLLDLA